jgi:hypothetical protein
MAHTLTQSLNLVAASTQCAYRADDPDILGNMTLEGWVKFTTLPPDSNGYRLVTKDDFGSNRTFGWSVILSGGQYFYTFRWFGGGTNGTVTSAAISLSSGTWYHMGVTRSSGVNGPVLFYLNGVSVTGGNTTTGSLDNTASDFMIGAGGSNTSPMQPLNGRMSLWRAWTVVQTTQILTNQCNVLGATTNLEAEWTFNNVYTDNTGNGNTLTGKNTPTFATDVPSVCVAPTNSNFFMFM